MEVERRAATTRGSVLVHLRQEVTEEQEIRRPRGRPEDVGMLMAALLPRCGHAPQEGEEGRHANARADPYDRRARRHAHGGCIKGPIDMDERALAGVVKQTAQALRPSADAHDAEREHLGSILQRLTTRDRKGVPLRPRQLRYVDVGELPDLALPVQTWRQFHLEAQQSVVAGSLHTHDLGGAAQGQERAAEPRVAVDEHGDACHQEDEREPETDPIVCSMDDKQDDPHWDKQVVEREEAPEVGLACAPSREVAEGKDHQHEQVTCDPWCRENAIDVAHAAILGQWACWILQRLQEEGNELPQVAVGHVVLVLGAHQHAVELFWGVPR